MSAEKQPGSINNQNELRPTELAPFRSPDGITPDEQFRLVNQLSEYLESPYRARFHDIEKNDIDDSMSGQWDPEYENYLDTSTRDSLDHIAANGKTFLVQELARGLVESPLARTFDKRPGHNTPSSREDVLGLLQGKRARTAKDLSEAENEALTLVATRELAKYGEGIDPALLEMRKSRILEWGNGLIDKTSKRAFSAAERELIERGYLSEGQLENDVTYLAGMFEANIAKMQGRMWHLAYEMPQESVKQLIEPYSFEMVAYGDLSRREVSDELYDKFTSLTPIDYKEIQKAGLLYAPVRMSTDTIGFFEETGRLAELFHTTENLAPGSKAEAVEMKDYIRDLLVDADEDEIQQTADVHYRLAGNLQVRNIIEDSLGVRLETLSLKEQILLSKLLNKATPRQMEAVIAHGSETIKNVARALEFGDDYANKILSVAEHASPEQAGKIFETINEFRDSSAKFAGLFGDFDPSFAEATEQAMNERLTDELYSVQQIVKDGRLEVDVAPHRNSPDYKNDWRFMAEEDSLEDGIHLLEHTKKTPELIANILTAPDAVVSKAVEGAAGSFAIYRVVSETYGQMLAYVREYGGGRFDRGFEYGNRDGAEASASFMVDPADPHRHLSTSKDPEAVSLRFDRQGFGVDESPFIEERSPIREKGSISLDISSGMGDPRSLPVRMGRFIAAGNLLRAEEVGSKESLHHNMNGFDQEKYGSVEGFAEVPRYIKRTLEAMMAAQRDRKLGSLVSRRPNIPSDYSQAA